MPSRVALLLATSVVLGLACRRSPAELVSIRGSAGAYEEPLRRLGLEGEALTAAATGGLAAAGIREGRGKGGRGYRARLEVVSMRRRVAEDGTSLAEVAADLELAPVANGGMPLLETGVGTARMSGGAAPQAWREALDKAAREAAAGLAVALSEEAKPVGKLIGDLSSSDRRVREQAIRVLGDRRSEEAVPALIERLQDPEPLLAERAAGALSQIRDRRAVGPIIDFSRRDGDAGRTARFARIIGDMGGEEARGYLLTLESAHGDPRVRRAASEALRDLDEREQDRTRSVAGEGGESRGVDSGRMER